MMKHAPMLALLLFVCSSAAALAQQAIPYEKVLADRLPLYGHRNWIVVVDSAYPYQSSAGVETIYTGGKQLDVVAKALAEVIKAPHVRPIIYVDKELQYVPEDKAPGIDQYRKDLAKLLAGQNVQMLPHEETIGKLDEAGKTFHVLVLKTDLTLPYTSVFIQLDCGYWSAEAEAELREKLEAAER